MAQKGYSLIAVMASIVIVFLLLSIGFSGYANYKRQIVVTQGINYISEKKLEVERCLIEQHNITQCSLNQNGITLPNNLKHHNIKNYNVENGSIEVVFNYKIKDGDNFSVVLFADPLMKKGVPSIKWTTYCSGQEQQYSLYKHCEKDVLDKPNQINDE